MEKLKALYIIANSGFSSQIVDITRECGSTGATILNARGSVKNPKTILGITIDTEKDVVLTVVKKEIALKIMEEVKQKAGVGTPAHALCFYMPIEMTTLNFNSQETKE